MSEHVVKNIGFLQIIELLRRADKIACRKAAVSEMIEEHFIGDQSGHGDDLPTGRCHQTRV